MGVGAYVYCRCWQDGLATPPPVGPVGLDSDGRLGLLTPWDISHAAEHDAVDQWLRTGCSHDDMEFADEYIGSWAAVRVFQETLRDAGEAHFPTLLKYLPRTNDGCVPAAEVPAVLAELEHFEKRARLPDEVVLADEATGDALYSYIEAYRGTFVWGRDYDIGVDPDGFFVLDNSVEPAATLFRAIRFEQRPLPGGELEFAADGWTVRLAMTPIGDHLPEPPRRLVVEARPRSAADFARLLEILRRLCAASQTTGNPISWT